MKTVGKVLLGVGGLASLAVIFWPRKAHAMVSSCREPVVGQRWAVCAPSGPKLATVSQGNFDALYDHVTRSLVAVVDNTTYDDTGDTAVVVSRSSAPWAADSLPAI
jgi:hypothetical protein